MSILYERLIILITLALGWLIPYFIGIRAYAVVAWVPFWLFACVLVPNVAKGVVPPKLEEADSVAHRSALRRNVELFISIWLYWALLTLMTGIMYGAMGNGREHLVWPLAWFKPARTKTTFESMAEIVLANSFIDAVCFFPLTKIFQAAFRRSHITQLEINHSTVNQDEDDDET